MAEQETRERKGGRPTKSPEGKRVTMHVSLSPEAARALKTLCDRPVAPIPESAMVEHLIMEQLARRAKDR